LTTLHRYLPHPPLSIFVEGLWLYQAPTPPHTKERRLPDGSASLVISLRDDLIRLYDQRHPDQFQSHHGMVLCGARSEFALLDTTCLTEVLGVQFKPGGTFPFLAFPASELHNAILSLDLVWGAEVLTLREQLQTSGTPWGRFQILEQFLLARLARSRAPHPVVTFALQAFEDGPSPPTISSVTAQIGLGQTRFIQLFREAVGLTPSNSAVSCVFNTSCAL
jgi:hypothetical protein